MDEDMLYAKLTDQELDKAIAENFYIPREEIAKEVADYRKDFILTLENGVYSLESEPGIMALSTQFVFAKNRVVIFGDVTPEEHNRAVGSVFISHLGNSPGWFTGDLSRGYLAEKFWVPKVYSPEATQKHVLETLTKENITWENDALIKKAMDKANFLDTDSVIEIFDGYFCGNAWEALVDISDPEFLGILIGLQRAFKRAYEVMEAFKNEN